ncbi:hypothetical protein H5410_014909 [Solanum commersonii]|uniref:Putative plant transposon protein domain-containing protein n=1 Tax=Solanum commersonii TaxID=4109 RepID=A0A9J5ZS52_SOLCO|nr:hypothetical protein H5410_014909 [Solanum commersonii]
MLRALSPAMLQRPSLPMLCGPIPSQPQGPARMTKLPHLMRPLARSLYQHQGIKILLQWPASQTDDPGTYSKEIVREFYPYAYAATLRGSISKRSKPMDQDPLTSTVVWGCPVDISHATISRFLYGLTTGHSWSLNTAEFEYIWDIVRSGAFQRNAKQLEAVILWLAKYIATDGERTEWIAAPQLGIQKATLNFVAKFFWVLVRNRVSPTKADNQLTWDIAIMVAALVEGVAIDFAHMLLVEIHERAFKTSTT